MPALQISDAPLRGSQLAAHVGLSPSSFAHAYSPLAGESPHRTIVRVKIETAKKLLVNERLTVREVARRLGYSSEPKYREFVVDQRRLPEWKLPIIRGRWGRQSRLVTQPCRWLSSTSPSVAVASAA